MSRIPITGSTDGFGLCAAQQLIRKGHNGVFLGPARTDPDTGMPVQVFVNVLAPYILTCLVARPRRLAYVSSVLHRQGDPASPSHMVQIFGLKIRIPQVTPKGCVFEELEALTVRVEHNHIGCQGCKRRSKPLTRWGARASSEDIANSLYPSLIELLKRVWDEEVLPQWPVIFLYIGALKSPDELRNRMDKYEEEGRFIKLYESSHFRFGDDESTPFDQTTLKASFITDYNDTMLITRYE
ncbi:hypothetical protein BJX64DRAFT_293602 [Aspergillus heterothallicus]